MIDRTKRVIWRRMQVDERVVEKISKDLGVSKIMARILVGRGLDTSRKAERFLNPKIEDAEDPRVFPHMNKAVERLKKAILKKETIGVFSDSDADGISAAAILHNFLLDCGVPKEKLIVRIPSRNREGYGLTSDFVQEAHRNGATLIITADCGIRNHFEVAYARSLGIDTIICDHHQMDYSLPQDAYAIIHPKMIEGETPLAFLSGAGTVFELVAGVGQVLRKEGLKIPRPRQYLDLLTIGTVGDMVPLVGDNRIFVKYGLHLLSQGTGNAGLRAIVERSNLKGTISTYDLQMKIIPKINSSGRAGKPELSFYLLTEQNPKRISEISEEIESANSWRKEKVQAIMDEIALLGPDYSNRYSIVAYGESWPEGVLGLVASRLLEITGKPTCVISIRKDEARGSVRSPDFLDIMGVLNKLSPMLKKYGGHPQAAGISLEPDKVKEFDLAFENEIRKNLENLGWITLEYDDHLVLESLKVRSMLELVKLEPFGEGNPFPLFLIDSEVVESRVVGEKHLKFYVKAVDGKIPVIAFGCADRLQPFVGRMKFIAKLIPSQTDGIEFEVVNILEAPFYFEDEYF